MGKVLSHPLTIVFITLCTVIFSLSMARSDRGSGDYRPQVALLEERKRELETQKEILEFKKELSAKTIVQEKIIRDDLWRQKPGEIVLDLADFKVVAAAPVTAAAPPPSPWEQWWEILR